MRSLFVIALLVFSNLALADSAPEIWNAKCKSCHAADGSGKTKVGEKEKITDMGTPDWQAKHSDSDIRAMVTDGSSKNTKMKAFKEKLTAAEIDSLVAHVRSLKK